MPARTATDRRPSLTKHSSVLNRISWIGLLVLAAFPLLGATADLISDQRGGIPGDHNAAFQALAGITVAQAKVTEPGLLRYVHQLEIGYAVHELVFAVLLLAVIVIPLRKRQRWAWFACWTILLADVTYAATFGAHDPTILRESLIGAIGMPVLLAGFAPACFAHRDAEHHPTWREPRDVLASTPQGR